LKICEICGTEFHPKHGNQKYCGEECSKIAEKENARQRMQKYRDKYGVKNKKKWLGSGNIGAIPESHWAIESATVYEEKVRLGLVSKKFRGDCKIYS